MTLVHKAAYRGQTEMVVNLVKVGADVDAQDSVSGRSSGFEVIMSGDTCILVFV